MSKFSFAFESWCTSTRPRGIDEQPEWGGDINTNEQWCSVVKGKIGDVRIILGGEVDCVRGIRLELYLNILLNLLFQVVTPVSRTPLWSSRHLRLYARGMFGTSRDLKSWLFLQSTMIC